MRDYIFPLFLLFLSLAFTFFLLFLPWGLKGELNLYRKYVHWGNYDDKIIYFKVICGVCSHIDV